MTFLFANPCVLIDTNSKKGFAVIMSERQSFFQRILAKISRFGRQIRGLFPSELPQGMQAQRDWVQSIMDTYDLPTNSQDDVNFVLSTMIMRLGPNEAFKSKYSFALAIRATAAKQIAGAVFQEIKERHKAADEAARKAAAEATAQKAAASDESKQ